MHLYVVVRGDIWRMRRFLNELSAQYFPYKYAKDKPPGRLQLAVRPIQLVEICFAEEEYRNVMETIWPFEKWKGAEIYQKFFTKLLGLKPIRKRDKKRFEFNHRVPTRWDVGILPIGIRKDKRDKDGIEKL